jgi:hypothetical protein
VRKWIAKAAIQAVLSRAPGGVWLNDHLHGRSILALDMLAFQQGLLQLGMLARAGVSVRGEVALEIGTGWLPIIPLLLRAAGAATVYMVDTTRYLNARLVMAVLEQLRALPASVFAVEGVTDPDKMQHEMVALHARASSGDSLDTLLTKLGLRYAAPATVRLLSLPTGSVRVFSSRAVLEHIPLPVISDIYQEMKRLLHPDGAMVHTIDHSDHWQHFDRAISRINFLTLGDRFWSLANSRIAYQNRARVQEHVRLVKDAGFSILELAAVPDPVVLRDVQRLELLPHYRAMKPEDVAVMTSHIVARPS